MPNLNKVFLMGNLTRDPELRYTPSGTPLAGFGLAVNRVWKDANGQQQNDTLFIDVTAFSGQAETICRYFHKGSPIFVEGRLRLDTWDDRNTGQKRSRIAVVLEGFQFLDSGNRGDNFVGGGNNGYVAQAPMGYQRPVQPQGYERQVPPQMSPQPAPPPAMGGDEQDDDVPF